MNFRARINTLLRNPLFLFALGVALLHKASAAQQALALGVNAQGWSAFYSAGYTAGLWAVIVGCILGSGILFRAAWKLRKAKSVATPAA